MTIHTKDAEAANQAHWDEIAPVHLKSYDIERLMSGVSLIDEIQKQELYPVKGKDIIHLQCHIGTDTLSLALDGAIVTGVDFSAQSIGIAKELADQLQLPVEFIQANVLELTDIISNKYDVVYTSQGVLAWISDIDKWAETISFLLKDGGIFYIMEIHPTSHMFDDTIKDGLKIKYSYFNQKEPQYFDDDSSDYSDHSYIPENKTYEWTWSLSDILNSLIQNGLKIEMLNEYDRAFHKALPGMTKIDQHWWILEKYKGIVPFVFTLRARKA